MTTRKRAPKRAAARPASSKPLPASVYSLTSQGFDRLRARVNAASNEAGEASVTSAREKKRILDALARLEADFERVLKPE